MFAMRLLYGAKVVSYLVFYKTGRGSNVHGGFAKTFLSKIKKRLIFIPGRHIKAIINLKEIRNRMPDAYIFINKGKGNILVIDQDIR